MKFGQLFKVTLRNEGFPPEWIESAISYSQLKKCINRLSTELSELGLDPETLGRLLKHVEDYNAAADQSDPADRPFEYILDDSEDEDVDGSGLIKSRKTFQPKLVFHVDEVTGALHSAQLDEKTKRKLQMLAVETGMTELRVFEEPDTQDRPVRPGTISASSSRKRPGYRRIEIPLTSDTEFFTKLTAELSGLEALQKREEQRMHGEITNLGKQIAHLTDPDRRANKKLLSVWRQIFQMYLEEGIFFGTTESDHSAHDAAKAQERLNEFYEKLRTTGLTDKLKKKENTEAFQTFMHINHEILQGLRFGEINETAMRKILKKFDKRTALGVKATVPKAITYPSFSSHLARAVCAEVSTEILSHVPQIEDYACPMCMDLKWRPVRLSCGHVFCIRCLIVMQNNKQDRCPLCRERTVADANSDNLDEEMAGFLKKWFPEEVKEKQRYNEVMAGVDQYGEVYKEKCCVM
ncbi:RING-14 protein-like protein [Karstenula rhodostoma CBS 690.94]|uniref:RING-14 protein-like protein n=1 Tax=Karstenula rhodostoma CBS 690.94 TaxID=1392251 RepID=A0A9P4UBJ5_9PLEO|nr:RING-14 protein-like protein [Karstenula rhodostoma CBS 690.94]